MQSSRDMCCVLCERSAKAAPRSAFINETGSLKLQKHSGAIRSLRLPRFVLRRLPCRVASCIPKHVSVNMVASEPEFFASPLSGKREEEAKGNQFFHEDMASLATAIRPLSLARASWKVTPCPSEWRIDRLLDELLAVSWPRMPNTARAPAWPLAR